MRVTSAHIWRMYFVLTAISLLIMLLPGCKPHPLPEVPTRKVIITNSGEVTKDACYVGETIRYKIYFANNSKRTADIHIIDRLDPNLGKVVPLNNGLYDKNKHLVSWTIKKVPAGTGGAVEFEGAASGVGSIRNRALIKIGGRFDPGPVDIKGKNIIKTNTVETLVRPDPELGWIPFDRVAPEGALPAAALKEETTMGTLVRFDIPGLYARKITVDKVTFHRLSIPRHTTLLDIGKPELPIVGQIIEIPQGCQL